MFIHQGIPELCCSNSIVIPLQYECSTAAHLASLLLNPPLKTMHLINNPPFIWLSQVKQLENDVPGAFAEL